MTTGESTLSNTPCKTGPEFPLFPAESVSTLSYTCQKVCCQLPALNSLYNRSVLHPILTLHTQRSWKDLSILYLITSSFQRDLKFPSSVAQKLLYATF